VIFNALNGVTIRRAALHIKGATGLSGVDAFCWRRLCTSIHLASDDLGSLVARCLCVDVHLGGISAYVTCRLIALNGCPGVV